MNNKPTGYVSGINGPILTVLNGDAFCMSEMVLVSRLRLIGEVISVCKTQAVVQMFEDTSGLRPNDTVVGSGAPLSASLGPGIIGNIFDGIQRPLKAIEEECGVFISRGVHVGSLNTGKKWPLTMHIKEGEKVLGGMVVGEVPEGSVIHKIMLPPHISGTVAWAAANGEIAVTDTIACVIDKHGTQHDITMQQRWPIRLPRPVQKRKVAAIPLVTGQRVIDTLFPVAKGGMAAIPGGFGTGKTITQHQLAKWADADIIVYIGCGERGNEMTQVLEDFTMLKDPRTNKPLLERTILIANTSNMPVAAREASIYTAITIAEYYRDMGYHVALMADSTSRWAEALRELSGRLEEMPAEEGFPASLASKLSSFYERAGFVETLSANEGSVTIIGAVSPQGSDFSEPVTLHTKRFVRTFWALDRALAYARHFPAIQWTTSYSEYLEDLEHWYEQNAGKHFMQKRALILKILTEEAELMEIVKLIGADVLPDEQKLILEIAKVIRQGFIQQNAYHARDTYSPLKQQLKMMEAILHLYERIKSLLELDLPMNILKHDDIFNKVIAAKYEEDISGCFAEIDSFYNRLRKC